ncbi:hypothetical protein [Staphylococcus devriesei]|uniref:Uncharacterized protein n=1 Tax=Staphylococcus devriesei TaxID=586733 RepID=A0A2T4KIR5_9STAP|nr:hypothetical protein [Staphylococcus devriesei]PTE73896.1 hypothetical protein BUY44_03730 [Staphylococcus devriesei]
MIKLTMQLLLIIILTYLVTRYINFHTGLTIYFLGSLIALINYDEKELEPMLFTKDNTIK